MRLQARQRLVPKQSIAPQRDLRGLGIDGHGEADSVVDGGDTAWETIAIQWQSLIQRLVAQKVA